MEPLDLKLLNLVQKGIPLTERPFHDLAGELGVTPDEILERLRLLKEAGYIRRIGGVFDAAAMGYYSTLAACEATPDQVAKVAAIIKRYPQITHHYLRNNRLNIWFTLTVSNETEEGRILDEIMAESGVVKVYRFPAVKHFKLKVFFDMEQEHV